MQSAAMIAFVNSVGASPLVPRKVRWLLLLGCGIKTRAWNIRPRCFFGGPDISIGSGTMINQGCAFDTLGQVTIGDRCAIGMEVMFAASTHELGDSSERAGDPIGRPIVVEDGCWIGSRVTLLPGSIVGQGSVVGAGSVVAGRLEPNGVYHGVPARRVRSLDGPSGSPGRTT